MIFSMLMTLVMCLSATHLAAQNNVRFCATAAGSADLKGSVGMSPLRQAAIPILYTSKAVVQRDYKIGI